MRNLVIAAALSLGFVITTIMPDAEARNLSYRAKPGEKILLGWRSPFDRNCKVKRLERYTITKQPKLGRLRFRSERRPVQLVSKPSLNHCIGKRLLSSVGYYIAGKKRGRDSFSYYRVTRGKRVRFNITVSIR